MSRNDDSAPVAQKNCQGSRTPSSAPWARRRSSAGIIVDEDAGEDRRHFEDRVEREVVRLAQLPGRAAAGEDGEQHHRRLAPRRVEERRGRDDAGEQREVLLARDAQRLDMSPVARRSAARLAGVGPTIPDVVDRQQDERRRDSHAGVSRKVQVKGTPCR